MAYRKPEGYITVMRGELPQRPPRQDPPQQTSWRRPTVDANVMEALVQGLKQL